MEIKILEETKSRIKIEIIGEYHTLANSLRKQLWEDEHVTVAGYNIEHSLLSNPVMVVETDGKEDARRALFKALDSLRIINKQLLNEFNKAAK